MAAHSHAVHKPLQIKIRMNVVQLMQENGQCLMCFYQSYYSMDNLEVEKIGNILGLKLNCFFGFVVLFYFCNGFGSKISE